VKERVKAVVRRSIKRERTWIRNQREREREREKGMNKRQIEMRYGNVKDRDGFEFMVNEKRRICSNKVFFKL
jgi:hypothetical protein